MEFGHYQRLRFHYEYNRRCGPSGNWTVTQVLATSPFTFVATGHDWTLARALSSEALPATLTFNGFEIAAIAGDDITLSG